MGREGFIDLITNLTITINVSYFKKFYDHTSCRLQSRIFLKADPNKKRIKNWISKQIILDVIIAISTLGLSFLQLWFVNRDIDLKNKINCKVHFNLIVATVQMAWILP